MNVSKSETIYFQGKEYRVNEKQLYFCRSYALSGDAVQSYSDAYGCTNKKTTYTKAMNLLELEHILGCVAYFKDAQRKRMDIRDDRILAEYAAMAFSNVADLFDEDGNALPIKDLPEHTQRAIKKVKVSQVKQKKFEDANGEEIILESSVVEIDFHDKQKSLDRIAEIQGLISKEEKTLPPAEIRISVTGGEVKADGS